jgi:hypothetical protein
MEQKIQMLTTELLNCTERIRAEKRKRYELEEELESTKYTHNHPLFNHLGYILLPEIIEICAAFSGFDTCKSCCAWFPKNLGCIACHSVKKYADWTYDLEGKLKCNLDYDVDFTMENDREVFDFVMRYLSDLPTTYLSRYSPGMFSPRIELKLNRSKDEWELEFVQVFGNGQFRKCCYPYKRVFKCYAADILQAKIDAQCIRIR